MVLSSAVSADQPPCFGLSFGRFYGHVTARLSHAHGGGYWGSSDSGLRRFGVVKCRLWCVLAIATTGACLGFRVAAGEHAGRGPFEQAPKAPPFRRKTVADSKITAYIQNLSGGIRSTDLELSLGGLGLVFRCLVPLL